MQATEEGHIEYLGVSSAILFRHLSSSFREIPTLRVLLHSLIQLEPTSKFILAIQSVKTKEW